jgi:hypothetical protein
MDFHAIKCTKYTYCMKFAELNVLIKAFKLFFFLHHLYMSEIQVKIFKHTKSQ